MQAHRHRLVAGLVWNQSWVHAVLCQQLCHLFASCMSHARRFARSQHVVHASRLEMGQFVHDPCCGWNQAMHARSCRLIHAARYRNSVFHPMPCIAVMCMHSIQPRVLVFPHCQLQRACSTTSMGTGIDVVWRLQGTDMHTSSRFKHPHPPRFPWSALGAAKCAIRETGNDPNGMPALRSRRTTMRAG